MLVNDGDYDAGSVESLPRRQSLGYQINHLARLFERQLRIRIEHHGVVPGQFAQLLALYEEEGLTQRELCERVQIEQPTMSYTLQRMERGGLIERVLDPSDRRRTQIMLTPRSRALKDTLVALARQVNDVATRGISETEVAVFMSEGERMIENLTTAANEADWRLRR